MEYVKEIIAESLTGPALLANLSYILLIAAMLMSKVGHLRILAVGSGIAGFIYLWVFLGDRIASIWEVLFIGANLYQMAVTYYRDRMSRFSPDELAFRNACVPGLSASEARRVLALSKSVEVPPGTALTREGEEVPSLIFLLAGEVEIKVGDSVIGRCARGDCIGEIGVMGAEPATATAQAATPVRYLAFDGAALRHLIARNKTMHHELGMAFRHSIRQKLIRANSALASASAGSAA